MAKLMGTGRCDNDLKNKFNAMKRKKKISEEDLRGPAAEFIAVVMEVRAAEAEAPAAASALQSRRQQRAASEDNDNGSASTPEAPQPPRVDRPRRGPKPLRRLVDEQAPPTVACAPPALLAVFPDCCEPTPLMSPGLDKLMCPWNDGLEQVTPGWAQLVFGDCMNAEMGDLLDELAPCRRETCDAARYGA
jgi:hypothetical protein